MLTIGICLIPIVLYLLLIRRMDGFSLGSIPGIGESFIWGAACCALIFYAGSIVNIESAWPGPLIEESLKALPLAVCVYRKRTAFFAETLIYGAAIGAGFSMLENILYFAYSPEFQVGDAIVRGFGTSLLHMGCTALCASAFLLGARYEKKWKVPQTAVSLLAGLVPSFVIHYIYNLFLLPELLQLAIVIPLIIALFQLIYAFDSRKIHEWLDLCISKDIQLLDAIKEGQFSGTEAGEYLIRTRDRFKPEVFFDICVYLRLYLELSISAKARMIMKEAEMDVHVPEEEHKANEDKLAELHSLEKNIGVSGLSVLRPVIDVKAMDRWILESLL